MITTKSLYRFAGIAAIIAGIIFAGIQPFHPPDTFASVTTGKWAVIISLKLLMCFLFLAGILGIFSMQKEKAGWLGLVAFAIFGLSWALQSGFVFAELFVLPPLASVSPQFVESALSVGNGMAATMNIGALGSCYQLVGICYLLGGIGFGITTYRARVFPRWPAGLLAITALLTPLAAFLPHNIQRFAAVPMGIAIASLGYALTFKKIHDA